MNPEIKPELQSHLVDDFCAEGDEHLKNIRHALGVLEESLERGAADPATIDELFREFHSFKGISAIVNLRPAEELAHAAEDLFRGFKQGASALQLPALEMLMEATQKLEEMVVGVRSRAPMPDIGFLLASLKEAVAANSEQAPPSWRFTFVPKQELDARGVNVNTVRARISALGEIVRAAPIVRGEGQIAFEFLTRLRAPLQDLAPWQADGILVEAVQSNPVTEPAAATVSPPQAGAAAQAAHHPFVAPSHVLRVDLNRLDELMRITGELVVHRSRLEDQLNRANRTGEPLNTEALNEFNVGLGRSLRDLRSAIMRVRMVPVEEIFARMSFVVRDLVRETRKQAQLLLEGQNTELDKYVLERLKDPLLHLVRNAFSHGVETAQDRLAAGKPAEAKIILRAKSAGDAVLIQIEDDGRGIDSAAVLRRARERGLPVPATADAAALLQILCLPGFSTHDGVDRVAGRGVGMSVVADTVRELGGSITLESELGRGTRFTLRLPLTLAIAEALIVSAAGQTCAIPQSFVREVVHVQTEEIRVINRVEVVPYRTGALPITRLSSFFQLPPSSAPQLCMLVLRTDRGSSGLLVDRIHGQKEVVVRAIRDRLGHAPGIVGATELGDGRPVLILDGDHLTRGAIRPQSADLAE